MGKGENIPLRLEIKLVVLDLQEDRVIIITPESLIIHMPQEIRAIGSERQINDLRSRRLLNRDRADRNLLGQRIVLARRELLSRDIGGRRRNGVAVGVLVVDGCYGVRRDAVVESAASSPELGAHPDSIVRGALRFDDDVGALANTKGNNISGIWLNGDKVLSDNSKGMVVNAEFLGTFCASVDEAKEMLLARLESELGNAGIRVAGKGGVGTWILHLSVDKIVVGRRSTAIHRGVHKCEVILVVPVFDQDRADVDVVFLVTGSIDDHRTVGTARILRAIMA